MLLSGALSLPAASEYRPPRRVRHARAVDLRLDVTSAQPRRPGGDLARRPRSRLSHGTAATTRPDAHGTRSGRQLVVRHGSLASHEVVDVRVSGRPASRARRSTSGGRTGTSRGWCSPTRSSRGVGVPRAELGAVVRGWPAGHGRVPVRGLADETDRRAAVTRRDGDAVTAARARPGRAETPVEVTDGHRPRLPGPEAQAPPGRVRRAGEVRPRHGGGATCGPTWGHHVETRPASGSTPSSPGASGEPCAGVGLVVRAHAPAPAAIGGVRSSRGRTARRRPRRRPRGADQGRCPRRR